MFESACWKFYTNSYCWRHGNKYRLICHRYCLPTRTNSIRLYTKLWCLVFDTSKYDRRNIRTLLTLTKDGDTCQSISLNQSIAIPLFEQINPSINSGCTNLELGLNYCVKPTYDWNANRTTTTGPSTTQAAPAPTGSGTIGSCYTWYVVKSGDYCSLIESSYGIADSEFRLWNPSLDANCGNLVLGNA